jgi:CheY-like chemotaxis protein
MSIPSALMRELTLLIVDPHKGSGVYCSALLQASNHRVYRVSTEQDALARIGEVDGVITEVQGFPLQFAARLREAAQNPHLAVIALTSYTLMEEYNRILNDVAEIILPTLAQHPGYAHVQKSA